MSFANEKANHAIECHVTQCNNHCGCADYCYARQGLHRYA